MHCIYWLPHERPRIYRQVGDERRRGGRKTLQIAFCTMHPPLALRCRRSRIWSLRSAISLTSPAQVRVSSWKYPLYRIINWFLLTLLDGLLERVDCATVMSGNFVPDNVILNSVHDFNTLTNRIHYSVKLAATVYSRKKAPMRVTL